MDEKKKWEDKYNFYKDMIENGEKGGEENEIEGLKGKILQYKREQAAIQDTISKQYRDYQKMIQDTIKQIQKKEKNVVLKKEQYKKLPVIKRNMKTIKKLMEERSVYQELLDEIEAKKERRSGLQEEKSRLEAELKELMEIEEYCNNALKNPKATAEQKENARRKLEEINKNKNKNNEAFVKNQKNFEEELKKNGVEVPENGETELKDNIEKLDRMLEALFDGKSIGDYRRTLENDKRGINVTTPQKTEEPAAEPMVEEPVVEESVVEEPVVEEPVVEEPVVEEPVVEEPVVEEPVVEEPVVEEPVVEEPVVEESVVEEPVVEEPVVEEPVAEPAVEEPIAEVEDDDLPSLKELFSNNRSNTNREEEERETREPEETQQTFLKKVIREGKKYRFVFENQEEKSYRKLGFIATIKEKIKILKAGVPPLTALKADANITYRLAEMKDENYYLEGIKDVDWYLSFINDPKNISRPFAIEYDKSKSFYARALKAAENVARLSGPHEHVENESVRDEFMDTLRKGVDETIQTPRPHQTTRDEVVQEDERDEY